MNISPIQIRHLAFRKVCVEVDVSKLEASGTERPSGAWDLNGASIHTTIGVAPADTESVKSYFLTLRVQIGCDTEDPSTASETFPYIIDVEAGASFKC